MRSRNNIPLLLLGLLVLFLAAGCAGTPRARIGHHLSSAEDILRLQRVVFIELDNKQCSRDLARQMTDSVLLAVQRRNLFLASALYRSNPIFEKLNLPDRQPLSLSQIRHLRDVLQCDAVIFGSVGHFRPDPSMQIGLYLNLVDLRQGRLIWGIDHIWDTTDKLTESRIETFFTKKMRSGYGPAKWRMGLHSPRIFGKFVAYEAAETLPSRNPVQQAP